VLLLVVAITRQPMARTATILTHLAVMALGANIVPYMLFTWGEQRISSGLAGTLNATTPLFTMVFVLVTGWERLSLSRASGLVVGFAGVVVLAAPWHSSTGLSSLTGVGACLLASASFGISYVYARRFLTARGLSSLTLAAGQLCTGTLMLGLAAPVVARQPVTLTPDVVGSLLMLGFGTGVAYILNYRLIADEGATAASTVTYLLPIVAILLGVMILAEPVRWNLAAGGVVVLTGVALSEGRISRKRRPNLSEQQAEFERML